MSRIKDDRCLDEEFDGDTIVYLPLTAYPSFYEAQYRDFADMVEKNKEEYKEYLPEDFDWENHLVHIVGTTWG